MLILSHLFTYDNTDIGLNDKYSLFLSLTSPTSCLEYLSKVAVLFTILLHRKSTVEDVNLLFQPDDFRGHVVDQLLRLAITADVARLLGQPPDLLVLVEQLRLHPHVRAFKNINFFPLLIHAHHEELLPLTVQPGTAHDLVDDAFVHVSPPEGPLQAQTRLSAPIQVAYECVEAPV